MSHLASDILATLALVVLLAGINDQNPDQGWCIAAAAALAYGAYKFNR